MREDDRVETTGQANMDKAPRGLKLLTSNSWDATTSATEGDGTSEETQRGFDAANAP